MIEENMLHKNNNKNLRLEVSNKEFCDYYQELNLDLENRKKLLTNASKMGIQFLESLKSRRAFPSNDDLNKLKEFIEPIPEDPSDPELTLLMRVNSVDAE